MVQQSEGVDLIYKVVTTFEVVTSSATIALDRWTLTRQPASWTYVCSCRSFLPYADVAATIALPPPTTIR